MPSVMVTDESRASRWEKTVLDTATEPGPGQSDSETGTDVDEG